MASQTAISYYVYNHRHKASQIHVKRQQPHERSKEISVHRRIANVRNAMHQTQFSVCNKSNIAIQQSIKYISLCCRKACVEISQRNSSCRYHLQWKLRIDLETILRHGLGRWGRSKVDFSIYCNISR